MSTVQHVRLWSPFYFDHLNYQIQEVLDDKISRYYRITLKYSKHVTRTTSLYKAKGDKFFEITKPEVIYSGASVNLGVTRCASEEDQRGAPPRGVQEQGSEIKDEQGQDIVYNIAIMTEGTVMTSAGVRDKGNECSLIARVQVKCLLGDASECESQRTTSHLRRAAPRSFRESRFLVRS